MTIMKLGEFTSIDLFADIPHGSYALELEGEQIELEQGENLFQEGDVAHHFYVILEGTIQAYRIIKGQRLPITNFPAGTTGGEVPLLSGTPHLANGAALVKSKVLALSEETFWLVMGNCASARKKILENMARRMQDLQLLSSQREKLVSLGTMAAGLAHELNNPAAAAKRSAQEMGETLDHFNRSSTKILAPAMFKEVPDVEFPFQPMRDVIGNHTDDLDPIEQAEREDDLADWIEEIGGDEPWDAAATLVSVGFTREWLEDFAEQLRPDQVVNSINWLAKDVEMRALSGELIESTARISDLVSAMKSYSYMDQAVTKQPTDLHEGLDNTLVILNHKFKKKAIHVVKEYSEEIPQIPAYGGELNQVWTNLLDNAIDAVGEDGTITVCTQLDDDDPNMIVAKIIDDGHGIPADVQAKIFDPFFTTKGVGQGTGLGLEISHRIVVNRHGGYINVQSQPGHTAFRVCLPIIACSRDE